MISSAQDSYIKEHAYLPEHLVSYVTAIREAEPFLLDDFLVYHGRNDLVVVGYPLKEPFAEDKLQRVIDRAIERFAPENIALIAPAITPAMAGNSCPSSDSYFKLDLSSPMIPQKTRNMINRAGRELSIQKTKLFGSEHGELLEEFLKSQPLDEATRSIFAQIPRYLSLVPKALILEARNKAGTLIAFDVADFSAHSWAMYMFNFTAKSSYVPGASDLLLGEIVSHARAENKTAVNLGLGINPGVVFFKKKWGGFPFIPYSFCLLSPRPVPYLFSLLPPFY